MSKINRQKNDTSVSSLAVSHDSNISPPGSVLKTHYLQAKCVFPVAG